MARVLLFALVAALVACAMTVPAAAKSKPPCNQHVLDSSTATIQSCGTGYINTRVNKMCSKHVREYLSKLPSCSLAGVSDQLKECFEAVRIKEDVMSKPVICTKNSMDALEWATQCC